MYGAPQPVLTKEIWDKVLERKLYEHEERRLFRLGHHGTGDSPAAKAAAAPPPGAKKQ